MKPVLVCLHGWGGSHESFTELRAALADESADIFTPDLPGFGDEPEPPAPWSAEDYADWAEGWIRNNVPAGRPLLLLGHSHGGRIAIVIAARDRLPIAHLYLCAAAGVRHPRHLKRIIGLTLAKSGKALLSFPGMRKLQPLGKRFLYRLVRVHDYEKASPLMRETLIRVSAGDLRSTLSHVQVPTDIFWGTEDGMTPVSDAHVMEQRIAGSRLHLYPGVRHRVHRDRAAEIAAVIREDLQ
jgi:pimeloyl-ACP methyl ester carboxylesterase